MRLMIFVVSIHLVSAIATAPGEFEKFARGANKKPAAPSYDQLDVGPSYAQQHESYGTTAAAHEDEEDYLAGDMDTGNDLHSHPTHHHRGRIRGQHSWKTLHHESSSEFEKGGHHKEVFGLGKLITIPKLIGVPKLVLMPRLVIFPKLIGIPKLLLPVTTGLLGGGGHHHGGGIISGGGLGLLGGGGGLGGIL